MTQPQQDKRRASRVVVVLLSLALGAVWLIPGTAINENRLPVQFPEVSRSAVASAEFFRGVDAALVDRLPAKTSTVAAVGSLLVGAGLTSTGAVVVGDGGRPYFAGDFTGACANEDQVPGALRRVTELRQELAADGVGFLYAVPPDKSGTVRAQLGFWGGQLLACSDRIREQLQTASDDSGTGILTAYPEFGAAQSAGEELYIFGDSHWNWRGGALFSQVLLDRLAAEGRAPAGLFDPSAVVGTGEIEHTDDLFALMGQTRTEQIERLETRRPGVTTTVEDEAVRGFSVQRWESTGPAEFVPGRTLILHDSYLGYDASILAPYFESLTAVPLDVSDDPGKLAREGGYDLVIVQQVQRSFPTYLGAVEQSGWLRK